MSDELPTSEAESDPESIIHLAHDLHSPLSIVKGALIQLLTRPERHGPLSAQQKGVLDLALRSAHLLEDLIDGLVAMHVAEAGDPSASTTLRDVLFTAIPTVLNRVASAVEAAPRERADEGLLRRFEAQGIDVDADPAVLEARLGIPKHALVRVVMNLVGNALRHAPGPVVVRARRVAAGLELAVVDRGPGLPADVRRALCAPSGDAAARPTRARTGLGLPATRWLVHRLGGSLRCEPGAGGVGTTILVDLPSAFAEARP
jgi:two-component system sensor histidine kinase KdpD